MQEAADDMLRLGYHGNQSMNDSVDGLNHGASSRNQGKKKSKRKNNDEQAKAAQLSLYDLMLQHQCNRN